MMVLIAVEVNIPYLDYKKKTLNQGRKIWILLYKGHEMDYKELSANS